MLAGQINTVKMPLVSVAGNASAVKEAGLLIFRTGANETYLNGVDEIASAVKDLGPLLHGLQQIPQRGNDSIWQATEI